MNPSVGYMLRNIHDVEGGLPHRFFVETFRWDVPRHN